MKEKHLHKLKRHKYKTGNIIYFCVLPDCSFKIAPAFAVGKRSICNRCGESFLLTEYSIRLAKPHCEKCHQSKDSITQAAEQSVLTDIENITYQPLSLADRLKSVTVREEDEI